MLDRVKRAGVTQFVLDLALRAEAAWFDASRGVQTSGGVLLDGLTLVGSGREGFRYVPVRPSSARRIIEGLPIGNFADYTFIDLGSGKGRMLLIAGEYPFRQVQGVEFAVELHRQAQTNLIRYRGPRWRCPSVLSLLMDAVDYEFPPGNLVLYLFNPFGGEVIEKVLARLDASLREEPRDAIVVMLYPEHAAALDARPHFRLLRETRRWRIYGHVRPWAEPAARGDAVAERASAR
jgi:hypothetical protein